MLSTKEIINVLTSGCTKSLIFLHSYDLSIYIYIYIYMIFLLYSSIVDAVVKVELDPCRRYSS